MAEAGINTLLAISEASTLGPAAPYAMAAAAIQGAALEIAIASSPPPQAYTGIDIPYASPQGTPVAVHPGESVVTRSETEQNRRGASTTVQTWIGGRQVADTVAEEVHRGGAMTAQITRRTGRLGKTSQHRRSA